MFLGELVLPAESRHFVLTHITCPGNTGRGIHKARQLLGFMRKEIALQQEVHRFTLSQHFQEYLPNFSSRFASALRKPPMGLLYHEETGWNPVFTKTLNTVDRVCKEQEICAHGLDNHLLYVAQNAFALSQAIPEKHQSPTLDEGNLAFVALTHDLGYAHDGIIWHKKDAHGHELKSGVWVEDQRSTHEISAYTQSHIAHFDDHAQLFQTTIQSNTDYSADSTRLSPKDATNPTSEELFLLTFSLADKLDFFRSTRLEGLEKPSSYQENPYFFLADAVRQYTITSDETHVYYTVSMKNQSPRRGSDSMNFDTWKLQVQEQYGWIFELGEIFGKAVGKEFVIRQSSKSS